MTSFRNMKWLVSFLPAVCHYILIFLGEDGFAAARKPPPLSCPCWCGARGFPGRGADGRASLGAAVPGERDICNEGINWEENPASRTWSTGDTAEKGREQTSRQPSEPDKKETFPAQRELCRICGWKVPDLSPSLEERPHVTRLWRVHEDIPSVGRRLLSDSLCRVDSWPHILGWGACPPRALVTLLVLFGVLTSITSWGKSTSKLQGSSQRAAKVFTVLWVQSGSNYSGVSKNYFLVIKCLWNYFLDFCL